MCELEEEEDDGDDIQQKKENESRVVLTSRKYDQYNLSTYGLPSLSNPPAIARLAVNLRWRRPLKFPSHLQLVPDKLQRLIHLVDLGPQEQSMSVQPDISSLGVSERTWLSPMVGDTILKRSSGPPPILDGMLEEEGCSLIAGDTAVTWSAHEIKDLARPRHRPCEEYGVDMSMATAGTVTCWIASEEGKEYEVNWMCNMFFGPTAGRVQVDGNHCGGLLSQNPTDIAQMRGIRTSATSLERFYFSSVKTTDNAAFLSTPKPPELGEIRLIITNTTPIPSSLYYPQPVPEERAFHETSRMHVAHQTSFRSSTTTEAPLANARDYGPPVSVFCFKYRSLDVLQSSLTISLLSPHQMASASHASTSTESPRPTSEYKRSYKDGMEEEDMRRKLEGEDAEDDAKLCDLQAQITFIKSKKRARAVYRKKMKTLFSM
ncbi:hypothetical protein V5O48_016627 [Marasmius crinis-equi]|uniref:DUF7918 domain-containing protein n=1 Tax=Marasmius crinis-equi TaxID=585013 RepID=A0ABR3ER72_9AGAR